MSGSPSLKIYFLHFKSIMGMISKIFKTSRLFYLIDENLHYN